METRNHFDTEPKFVNTNPGMGGFIRKQNKGAIGRYRYYEKLKATTDTFCKNVFREKT